MVPAQKKAWGILGGYRCSNQRCSQGALLQTFSLAQRLPPFSLQQQQVKAIKTYGLRKVHLQSRGLSLEVSFAIADVVTPLHGLDIMIRDRLSLHVEQDFQHVLVNSAGDKTQLEHVGRHLYMIACPSQHGSSHCFIDSLSQVIGFLPADKELHEQRSSF